MGWKGNPRAVLIALLLIHVLAHVDRNMLLGFSPQITQDLALNNAQYGFLAGAVWVLSFGVMAVVMGSLADRFSRTRVIGFGILVWSACTAASGMAQNFEQMVAARFFVATGEAALVPAAVSLLMEIFKPERRSTAAGVFFMGIPLGIGLSFLMAGTFGVAQGWRDTFTLLGIVGVMIALPILFLRDRRVGHAVDGAGDDRGAPMGRQLRNVLASLRGNSTVLLTIAGFVLVHMVFVGLSFAQLWLVRERGFDPAGIARQIGTLEIIFGVLGAVVGGVLGDRLARRLPGGHAGLLVALVALCGPLMLAYRFAAPDSALFTIGMCAGFFLPLATYGPSLALIQGLTPDRMRATVTGFAMLSINVVAIALGHASAGWLSDRLASGGSASPLTTVLVVTDVLAIAAAVFFALAARGRKLQGPVVVAMAH